jgi:hypothetical protein
MTGAEFVAQHPALARALAAMAAHYLARFHTTT